MEPPDTMDAERLRAALRSRLEIFQRAGLRYLPRPKREQSAMPSDDSQGSSPRAGESCPPEAAALPTDRDTAESDRTMPTASSGSSSARAAKPKSATLFPGELSGGQQLPFAECKEGLEVLQQEVAGCQKCQNLAETRTQTVFGVGNPQARLCFCGEAPGADEDRQGEPFVGRAGQLLTKIIEACTLRREDVYILNVLKCRPPDNRNPLPTEVANCRGYLDRQLEIIRPEFICCLGTIAAQTLLETDQTIGRLRGRFHDYRGIPVWCTYHPAYLLRNPGAKRQVWDDMKTLLAEMGIEVEAARKG